MKKMFLSCAVLILAAMPAWAQISVSGEGKVSATPDMATVVLAVVTEDAQALQALNNNNETMAKLVTALEATGLTKKELQTDLFALRPKYVYAENKAPRLVGYTVTNSLTVMVCKTELLGKVLDNAVKNGATNIESLNWGFQDPEKLLDQARALAVLDAKRKANLLVNTSGSSLGTIVSISEQERYSPRTNAYSSQRSADSGAVIEAGQQTLRVSVSVVWNVGPPLK